MNSDLFDFLDSKLRNKPKKESSNLSQSVKQKPNPLPMAPNMIEIIPKMSKTTQQFIDSMKVPNKQLNDYFHNGKNDLGGQKILDCFNGKKIKIGKTENEQKLTKKKAKEDSRNDENNLEIQKSNFSTLKLDNLQNSMHLFRGTASFERHKNREKNIKKVLIKKPEILHKNCEKKDKRCFSKNDWKMESKFEISKNQKEEKRYLKEDESDEGFEVRDFDDLDDENRFSKKVGEFEEMQERKKDWQRKMQKKETRDFSKKWKKK